MAAMQRATITLTTELKAKSLQPRPTEVLRKQ